MFSEAQQLASLRTRLSGNCKANKQPFTVTFTPEFSLKSLLSLEPNSCLWTEGGSPYKMGKTHTKAPDPYGIRNAYLFFFWGGGFQENNT